MHIVRRRRLRPRRKLVETPETEALRAAAKAYLPGRVRELAARAGIPFTGRVAIKHNVSNWGSCSTKGNINLNLNLMRLPDELRDYVIIHELCHLRHMNHGPEFHALLEALCPDHLALRKALKGWKLI
ncbi:MAG: M48 family metallopeptidase [Bacteroidales bacterium]|nr:M48 family metallopeptidase [Bacteroidales bacterium]